MVDDPERWLEPFARAGCDVLTVHVETLDDPRGTLRRIRGLGCRAGLSLNPPTPVDAVLPHLDHLDVVLVMSVMPGFGGQVFDAGARSKVRALRSARPGLEIAIDGGIKPHNAGEVVADGVTQVVAGSAVFRQPGGLGAALAELRAAAAAGVPSRPSAGHPPA
jgi:ribulose-phosphate 3-epimerase